MPDWIELGPITVGPEPTVDQLKGLHAQGFKTVIDLRDRDDDARHIAPEEEQTAVFGLGMEYIHFPLDLDRLDQARIDEYRRHISNLSVPAFIHCDNGRRAALVSAIDLALKQGWSGRQTLDELSRAGYSIEDDSELGRWLVDYVDRKAD